MELTDSATPPEETPEAKADPPLEPRWPTRKKPHRPATSGIVWLGVLGILLGIGWLLRPSLHEYLNKSAKRGSALDPATVALNDPEPLAGVVPEFAAETQRASAHELDPPLEPVLAAPEAVTLSPTILAARAAAHPADLSGTSWQNPFDPSKWHSVGLEFSPDRMHVAGAERGEALFGRTYRKFMLEIEVASTQAPVGRLQLRIEAPETQAVMSISIARGVLTVTDDSQGSERIVKQKPLEPALAPMAPGTLRVAATGNRLVMSWNGRLLLSCDQLAAQSGRDLEWAILVDPQTCDIVGLRVEGE